ncbi:MAG: hypothetical protein ABJF23_33690, partial [Bryobacteraceae bacterium]
RPVHAWLQGRTSPEMLYLNSETVRKHMQATAERIEQRSRRSKAVGEYQAFSCGMGTLPKPLNG